MAGWVDPNLEFHDIAASRSTHKTSTDVGIGLGHGANVARTAVVVEQWIVNVSQRLGWRQGQNQMERKYTYLFHGSFFVIREVLGSGYEDLAISYIVLM